MFLLSVFQRMSPPFPRTVLAERVEDVVVVCKLYILRRK